MTESALAKLAVWTGDISAVTGQNIVTRRVIDRQRDKLGTVYAYPCKGLLSIPRTLAQTARLISSVLFGRHIGVYVVCSRSTIGFFRDVFPLLMSRLGARVVVHVHGSDFPYLLERPVVGALARWLYASCEVIVPSSHLREPLAAFHFQRFSVCENFAEGEVGDTHSKHDPDYDSLTVLWNSNIMASKGIIELVEGMKILRKDGVFIKLVLLGRPIGDAEKQESEMHCYLERLRHLDWVEVRGVVPPEDLFRHIVESDVIALPSEYMSECQPLAVIQGMLAGKTLLVTNSAAMRATLGDYPAIFVEKMPFSICEAIRPLVASRPPIAHDAALRARVRFSPERFDDVMRFALAPPD